MSAPVQSCQPVPEPVRQHTPTPWTYSDVSGAGLEIRAPVYQVAGVELPKGMPEAPIKIFEFTAPQIVQIAAERWVQFEPTGWSEMQEANAAFIIEAVNSHAALKAQVKELKSTLRGIKAKTEGDRSTVNPENAFEHWCKLNAVLVSIRGLVRDALDAKP